MGRTSKKTRKIEKINRNTNFSEIASQMKNSTKNTLKYIFFFALAIALMYLAFRSINFDNFIEGLKSTNFFLIAISVIIGIAGYIIRSLRWKILIDSLGYKPLLTNIYNATMIGYLANFTIPRIGEIIRCTVLKKTDNIPFEKGFGTVIVERCYDLLFLILTLLFIVLFQFEKFGTFISDKIWTPIFDKIKSMPQYLIIIFLALLLIIFITIYYYTKFTRKSNKTSIFKKIISGLISGLKTGFTMKNRKIFFFYTILIYLCYWLTGYLVLKSIPTTAALSAIDALFLFVLGAFGWVIPAQGGFGSYHILVALGLGIYGISYTDGIIVATISHESQVVFMIILGLISLIKFSISKKQNKDLNKIYRYGRTKQSHNRA